jgi:glycosyltransferase involved in cell wall biosynthesis
VSTQANDQTARIAVIVPCFNDGDTVGDTIASVREQEPCELVVVDDGSDDPGTHRKMDELEAEGVHVVRQQNSGVSAARMAGLAATSSRYVYPLDSDDVLFPRSLTKLADALDADPGAAAAWGDTVVFGDGTYQLRKREVSLDPWRITYYNGLPYSSMFRRKAVVEAGGWQLLGDYEDWDLWMALAERGHRGVHVRTRVMRYRIHGARGWANAMSRHEQIEASLRSRHPALFEQRRENWSRSQEPWRLKLTLPVAARLPGLTPMWRRRIYTTVDDPREALAHLRRRVGRAWR